MAAAYACTYEHPFSALFSGLAADMEAAAQQQRARHGRCGASNRSCPPGRGAYHAGSPPAAGSRPIPLDVLEVAPCPLCSFCAPRRPHGITYHLYQLRVLPQHTKRILESIHPAFEDGPCV